MARRYAIGIRGKFVLSLLMVGLLPGVVGLLLTYVFAKKAIQNAVGSSFQELARESADKVDSFLRREIEDAKSLAIAPPILEAARRRGGGAPAVAYLRSFQTLKAPEYVSISLLDDAGRTLLTTGGLPDAPSKRPKVPFHEEGGRVSISELYFSREDPPRYLLDITVPVTEGGANPSRGMLRMTIRFQEVYDAILGVKIGRTGHGMLVSSAGTPLICPILPPREHLLKPPLMALISQKHPGWAVADDDGHGGRWSIIGFAPVPLTLRMGEWNSGGGVWYTFIRQDPRETFTPLYIFLGNLAVVGFGLVSLLSMFGLYVGATIVKPIKDLQRWTESPKREAAVLSEDPAHRPSASTASPSALEEVLEPLDRIGTGDEIEDLARAFSRMTCASVDYQRRLIRSEKLAAMGKLAAIAAHEIRNPLNAVLGAAAYLKSSMKEDDGKGSATIDLMVREIRRLDQFVSDVLTMVQEPAPRLSEIHLSPLMEESLHLLGLQGRLEKVRVVRNFPSTLPAIPVDPDQVRRVILNLLSNALDAMPSGGTLTLTAAMDRESAPDPSGNWFSLKIGDTGVGIPPEDRGRLFEPFYSTKERGIGLGLAISRGIMEKHGGKISVESREGEGTTFTLLFRTGEKPV